MLNNYLLHRVRCPYDTPDVLRALDLGIVPDSIFFPKENNPFQSNQVDLRFDRGTTVYTIQYKPKDDSFLTVVYAYGKIHGVPLTYADVPEYNLVRIAQRSVAYMDTKVFHSILGVLREVTGKVTYHDELGGRIDFCLDNGKEAMLQYMPTSQNPICVRVQGNPDKFHSLSEINCDVFRGLISEG